jgi:hypothetical protein
LSLSSLRLDAEGLLAKLYTESTGFCTLTLYCLLDFRGEGGLSAIDFFVETL